MTTSRTLILVTLTVLTAAPAAAQAPDADCQAGRERLAGHARASDAVRKLLAGRAGTAPAASTPAVAPGGRAAEVRTRLAEIPRERQRAEDTRVAAMVRLDFSRAAQAQAQLEALEAERKKLERELATLPAGAGAPPAPATPAAPAAGLTDADRVPCRDVAATLDAAVKTRRRELGAREAQPGAIPLLPLRGQTAAAVARELAAQFAPWPDAAGQVGLLDQDGRGRIDAVVDVPAKDLFRVVRLRGDGALGVDVFAADANATGYGEAARRLEEAALRRGGRKLEDVLTARPAGPTRVVSETSEARRTLGRLSAGEFAEAAKAEPGARAVEFENLRGEIVRVLEVVSPTASGVDWRRVVVIVTPGAPESWEETTLRLKPVSFWRTDAELTIARETRGGGAAAPQRTVTGPVSFSLER
ncbi:MAG TPA: hypothetical protein VGT02_14830 [Methylomirabilota bacterium]|nr:hypothetical protein [Methylomirabilota bacterium]